MKDPLAGITVAIAGQLRNKEIDIQRWVRNNGGIFATKLDKNVTHLICSMEAYKARCARVKQAIKLGIHIVTYDWLEDSLMKHRPLKERGDYVLWRLEEKERKQKKRELRKQAKVEKAIERDGKIYKRSIEEYHLEMGFRTHHIYSDSTGFVYDILLSRVINISTNKNEHFHLKLYESNAIPHLYAAVARYRRPGAGAVEILAPVASFFHEAFTAFRAYFKRFTGYAWEDRLDSANQDITQAVRTKTVVRGGVKTEEQERLYRYCLPQPNKPRGLLHPDKQPQEVVEISDSNTEDDKDSDGAEEDGTEEGTEEEDESEEEVTSEEVTSEEETTDEDGGSGESHSEEEGEDESDDREGDSSDGPTDSDSSSGLGLQQAQYPQVYEYGI